MVPKLIIERKTGTNGTYARIATTGTGITTYTDSTVLFSSGIQHRLLRTSQYSAARDQELAGRQ